MKLLTFILGLIIGLVGAYVAIEADVVELPFLEQEEVAVEEPVEVEEEEENVIVEGYQYDQVAEMIPFAGDEFSYRFSDEFVTMVEETGGIVISTQLPYTVDNPETVYVVAAYNLLDTDVENRTDFFEYDLLTNEYIKKFEFVSDSYIAIPRGIDGSKLVFSKSATDFGPPICGNAWDMWEQYYFDLTDPETVATEYEIPPTLREELDIKIEECEFLQDLTGFEYPGA